MTSASRRSQEETGGASAAAEPQSWEDASRNDDAESGTPTRPVDPSLLSQKFQELEATRQRVVRDAERAQERDRAELVAQLFPVLDNLDRSIAAGGKDPALLDGVRLVQAQLEQVLSEYGVERIESVGQPFDPAQHEAVDVVAVKDAREHNVVQEEWEAGYRYQGRVLRAAKVRVGRSSSTDRPAAG